MRLIPMIFTLGLMSVVPAVAQGATCLSTPGHLVATAPNEDVGDSFAIYHKDGPDEDIACRFDPAAADLVIEGWYALEGVMGDYLVASEGSSAVRTLHLFELNKGKALVVAEGEYEALLSTGLIYWERREPATADSCPQFEEYTGYGGSGVISHRVSYDFATRKQAATGETRCDYLE